MLRTKPWEVPKKDLKGKEYTTFNIVFLAISYVIGTGVYFSSVTSATLAASASIPALLICGSLCLSIILPFAELAVRFPGSTYDYIYCTCGEFIALFYSLTNLLTDISITAINAQVWSNTIRSVSGYPLKNLELLPIVGISALVIMGRRVGALASNIATIINLANAILAGVLLWSQEDFTLPWNKPTDDITNPSKLKLAFPVWFFTFLGFENIGGLSRGMKSPGRVIPSSMILALGSSIFLNLFTLVGVFGQNNFSNATSIIDLVKWDGAKTVMRLASICGITSSSLRSASFQGETLLTLSNDGLAPKVLRRTNSTGTAYVAVIFQATCAVLCTYSGSIGDLIELLNWVTIGLPTACMGLVLSQYKQESSQFFRVRNCGFVFALVALVLGLLDSVPGIEVINTWQTRIIIGIVMAVTLAVLCKSTKVTYKSPLAYCILFPYLPIVSSLVFFFVVGHLMNVKSFLCVLAGTFVLYFTYSGKNSKLATNVEKGKKKA